MGFFPSSADELFLWWGDSQFLLTGMWEAFGSFRQGLRCANTTIANAAVSGSRTDQWLPGSANYVAALAVFRAYLAQVHALTTVRGFMVQLGTNDAKGSGIDWSGNMATTLASFRSDLSLPSAQLVYAILPVVASPTSPDWTAIRTMQLSNSLANATGVQMPDDTRPDLIHFDQLTSTTIISPRFSAPFTS